MLNPTEFAGSNDAEAGVASGNTLAKLQAALLGGGESELVPHDTRKGTFLKIKIRKSLSDSMK